MVMSMEAAALPFGSASFCARPLPTARRTVRINRSVRLHRGKALTREILRRGYCGVKILKQMSRGLRDHIRRVELRHPCMPSGDPAKDVHDSRIGETASGGIRKHFEQGVVKNILVVVDIRFDEDTTYAVDLT